MARPVEAEFAKAKETLAKFREERARAEGRLEQLMEELRSKYGFETLDDAEAALIEMEKESAAVEQEFRAAWSAFKERWDERIGRVVAGQ